MLEGVAQTQGTGADETEAWDKEAWRHRGLREDGGSGHSIQYFGKRHGCMGLKTHAPWLPKYMVHSSSPQRDVDAKEKNVETIRPTTTGMRAYVLGLR